MADYLRTERWSCDGATTAVDILRGDGLPGNEDAEVVHITATALGQLLTRAGLVKVDG